MLFAFFLAFSLGANAQQVPTCPNGGSLTQYNGQSICAVPAPFGTVYTARYSSKNVSASAGTKYKALELAGKALAATYTTSNTSSSTGPNGVTTTVHTQTGTFKSVQENINQVTINIDNSYQTTCPETTTTCNSPAPSNFDANFNMDVSTTNDHYCPPGSYPALTSMADNSGNKICYELAVMPECDCSDLTGSNPQGINYFYSPAGTYSQANPPNCISRDDNEATNTPSCNCKLIATKWTSGQVTIDGQLFDRWQPVPDQNGVTGVYSGGQCDADEAQTPPEVPETCYQLGSGQNFCLEDPDTKCAKIDGILTCQAGCGSVNGEFFCFDNENPNEIPDPNDEISDPDKTMSNMLKSDFKDVLIGAESRLDRLASILSNTQTTATKGESEIASKLNATNRLLNEISGKLDGQGEEPGEEPITATPANYNTDKLTEFVNPNDWGEKNFRTVALAFKDRLAQAPIMDAIRNFFNVSFSGSCPVWQTTVSLPFGGVFDINLDQLCSDAMTNIWPAIRAIIILIFTFLAFRVAFTNE